eukprot:1617531-Amphidinium_carterae.1
MATELADILRRSFFKSVLVHERTAVPASPETLLQTLLICQKQPDLVAWRDHGICAQSHASIAAARLWDYMAGS